MNIKKCIYEYLFFKKTYIHVYYFSIPKIVKKLARGFQSPGGPEGEKLKVEKVYHLKHPRVNRKTREGSRNCEKIHEKLDIPGKVRSLEVYEIKVFYLLNINQSLRQILTRVKGRTMLYYYGFQGFGGILRMLCKIQQKSLKSEKCQKWEKSFCTIIFRLS